MLALPQYTLFVQFCLRSPNNDDKNIILVICSSEPRAIIILPIPKTKRINGRLLIDTIFNSIGYPKPSLIGVFVNKKLFSLTSD